MKNYIFLLILLLLFPLLSHSQQTWKTEIPYGIDGESIRQSSSFIKTQDGNYLFLYPRIDEPLGINLFTHKLVKYDTLGQLLWEKLYDSPPLLWELGGLTSRKATEMVNGDIVVVGRKRPEFIAYMYLTNSEGDSLLYREYPEYKHFNQVVRIESNIIGVSATNKATNERDVLRIEITNGDIATTTQYDLPARSYYFPEDRHHFFGYRHTGDSILLEKYAYTGELLLSNQILTPEGFGEGDGYSSGIAFNTPLNANGWVIYNNALLVVDTNLNPTFSVPYNEDHLNLSISLMPWHESNFVLPTSDGGYLLSGTTNTNGGNYYDTNVFFIKINSQGEEEWNAWFSEFELLDNYVPFIIEEADGYVFIGHSYIDHKIHMTKMTKKGELVAPDPVDPVYPSQLAIYPNPCGDYFWIDVPPSMDEGQLVIYSFLGQQMIQELPLIVGTQQIFINNLVSGVYVIQMINIGGEIVKTTKLIKH